MKNKQHYPADFYVKRHERTVDAARKVISKAEHFLPKIGSVIDFGCGVGSWLSVFKEKGALVAGLDGPWVPTEHLVIPREDFIQHDLGNSIDLERRFDLAISLEVAEHLPEKSAACFVRNLVRHSDFILFSAAIPFQGGSGHINEQWPSYWGRLFLKEGYRTVDLIRMQIWHDETIPYFYRQNICLFVKNNSMSKLTVAQQLLGILPDLPMDAVHPERFLRTEIQSLSPEGAWKFLRRAIRRSLKQKFTSGH